MRSELAEELLDRLMAWDRAAFQEQVHRLEALATLKFDEYGNFRPGVKFLESLAGWLDQFENTEQRAVALDFVLNRLIFISDAEMTHLIELVYPDHIEPVLRNQVVSELGGISPYAVGRVVSSPAFSSLRRRTLVLGASDGARLDRLRRSAPFLSPGQFLQSTQPPADLIAPMRDQLVVALDRLRLPGPCTFGHIIVVDDFAGSGETLLRQENGTLKGKLAKLLDAISTLQEEDLVADNAAVTVILYVASEQAREHLENIIAASPRPSWRLRIVQALPHSIRVDRQDASMAELALLYYDEILTDEHKGRAPLGYAGCALPVVLSHNTPNNSISLLWADTTGRTGSEQRRALFPRYERHHRDRP